MSEFKAGQRVRIEWSDGSAVEGVLGKSLLLWPPEWGVAYNPASEAPGRTVTVLSEPRPDEPTGLGAVVEAGHEDRAGRVLWIRTASGCWINARTNYSASNGVSWPRLVDPIVLSEGWTP